MANLLASYALRFHYLKPLRTKVLGRTKLLNALQSMAASTRDSCLTIERQISMTSTHEPHGRLTRQRLTNEVASCTHFTL